MAGAERVLPSPSRASGKSKKLQPLRYTAARLLEKGVLLEIEDLPVSQCVPLPPGRAVAAQSSGTGREVAALAVFLGLQWMRDPPLVASLPSRFKNVIFDIVPCEEAGRFQVKAKFMGIDMERFQLHYQVGSWGLRGGSCPRNGAVVLWGSLPLPRFPPPVVMSTPPAGPAAAAVRGRSRHEDVRQSQSQRQPAHLPPQQEVLQEVTGWGGQGALGAMQTCQDPSFLRACSVLLLLQQTASNWGNGGFGHPKIPPVCTREPCKSRGCICCGFAA